MAGETGAAGKLRLPLKSLTVLITRKEIILKTYLLADPTRYPSMTTAQLRETFLLDSLYEPGALHLVYVDLDRTIAGVAAPTGAPLLLPADPDLRAEYFTERRELGALNVGGSGSIKVNGQSHTLENLDCLYIGRGNAEVSFESKDPSSPAIFYLLSYPAHTAHPVALVRKEDASPTTLGSAETGNLRTVSKYIYLGGVKSCQLVMGVTHLHAGSVWNTMPPHTHMRRSEVYLYFNLAQEAVVFHLMGPPGETRHIVMKDLQAVVSPGWSVHAGVGTRAYSFCWGMGGENQDYADMDLAPIPSLR
jgi:4-deoxy-L-threo-5-hexosulose-uronate ketol-isomerase